MEAMQRAMATKVYQDFVPPTELVEEPECDTLLVYLPGYKKEQLRVQLTKTRNLVVSGEHPVGENTWRRFQKRIPISSNCDIAKITAKFEDSILYITQPKLIASAETQNQKKPTSNQEDLTQEQDQNKPTTTKTPEPYKYVDKKEDTDVVDQKQADNTNMETKETAEENVKKLSEKGNISQDVVDNYDAKTVIDKISDVKQTKKTAENGATKGKGDNDAKSVSDKNSSVKQTKKTAETGEMEGNGDQKQKTYPGYFATKLNIRKEVINIVIAILVAIAFGLHVKYSVKSWKRTGIEDV
ncbi:inactive protein RESTRICTED TEV MOVEMENT 2-like [Heracleum sosnowskyi]|uniref:Inactive protein RESTRICTED TEV MOVEMENT 2-like n=1 Tax=Heracleum sosnowskyi TaxID=360622 RepID=A0AAD8N3E3_9APIA|nr:inactive protein RESTRICTED TEV MOVEMENT 2-like [Heracleum sosnowskyi]